MISRTVIITDKQDEWLEKDERSKSENVRRALDLLMKEEQLNTQQSQGREFLKDRVEK